MDLQGYWISKNRKDLAERAIVAKRNQEAYLKQQHESAHRYHRDLNLLSTQYRNLEEQQSGKTPKVNEESRLVEEAKAKRREQLHLRREKLAALLTNENEMYLTEMKGLHDNGPEKDPWNINKLKNEIEELKKRREAEEEELRKRNSHHQQTTIPYLKEHTEELLEKEVKRAAEKKKKELELKILDQKAEDQRQLNELESLQDKALQELLDVEDERKKALLKYEDMAEECKKELDKKIIEYDERLKDVKYVQSCFRMVEGIESKWKRVKEIQAQTEQKISEFRLTKEKVRKMGAEVQHGLELDLATINYLLALEKPDGDNDGAHIAMDKVILAKETVMAKILTEKKRVAEIGLMFEEEARGIWSKRKQDWECEKQSQEELMNKIFEELKNQIDEKYHELLDLQRDLLLVRENLVDSLRENKEKKKEEERIFAEKITYCENHVLEVTDKLKKLQEVTSKKPNLLPKQILF